MSRTARKRHRRARPGARRQGREMALQMLYQWEVGRSHPNEVFRSFDLYQYAAETLAPAGESGEEKGSESAFDYARSLVSGTLERMEGLDAEIVRQAENWRLERMPLVDRNVLRLGVYQLFAEPDVPAVVIIDESIELAKKFGSERSGAFVNGLLDALSARLRPGDRSEPASPPGVTVR